MPLTQYSEDGSRSSMLLATVMAGCRCSALEELGEF